MEVIQRMEADYANYQSDDDKQYVGAYQWQ